MDPVSKMWFLHSFRNKLFWIRCDDLKINHPINETSVEAAEFSGHVKVKFSKLHDPQKANWNLKQTFDFVTG